MHNYKRKLESVLSSDADNGSISEGSIVSVNKLVSNAIGVPPGDYIIWALEFNTCNLIPTCENTRQQDFVVQRKTLEGFYNQELHKKKVHIANPTLNEEN